ncbi:MAG: glycosyltransferase family 2 protein [Dehalococcoidia bacterium]
MTTARHPSRRARRHISSAPAETGLIEMSIVMPCLNEEESVGDSVRKAHSWLEASGVRGEVIVVDNGSDDRSVQEATDAGARVIFESERGYGSALRRGIASSSGRYVVMGDCDETYDFAALDPFLAALRDGADLVVGNRYSGGIQPGAMTWSHRYIGTPAITFLVKLFSKSNLGDSQCGLRGFSRVAYDRMELSSDGMEFASEMIIKASRLGLDVREVPIQYFPRIGETKLDTFRDGWRHLRYLLLATPNGLYTMPGLLLALVGAGVLGLGLFSNGGEVQLAGQTWKPIFAGSILLTLGVNALLFGALANLYTTAKSITPRGGIVNRAASALLRFERALVGSVLLVGAGLGLDVYLAAADVPMTGTFHRAGLAAVAQAMILTAGSFGLAGFFASMLRSSFPRSAQD